MIKLYKEWVESKRLANIATRVSIVKQLDQLPYLGKRYILTEYLFTQDQLERNDALWAEENGKTELQEALDKLAKEYDESCAAIDNVANAAKASGKKGLRSVGITK